VGAAHRAFGASQRAFGASQRAFGASHEPARAHLAAIGSEPPTERAPRGSFSSEFGRPADGEASPERLTRALAQLIHEFPSDVAPAL
jgi:hypothetical protein